MSDKSIFRSFTLPNGTVMKTMRQEVRDTALRAVTDRAKGAVEQAARSGKASFQGKAEGRGPVKRPV